MFIHRNRHGAGNMKEEKKFCCKSYLREINYIKHEIARESLTVLDFENQTKAAQGLHLVILI